MPDFEIDTIDISNPLWHGLRTVLTELNGNHTIANLNRLATLRNIQNQADVPIQFVAQDGKCGQRAYEWQIFATGKIPTRTDNLHDLYNACIWLSYPKIKAALNAVHVGEPKADIRSKAGDAATIFDESGAILIGPHPELAKQVEQHHWHEAFVNQRDLWQTSHILIVGHAVLEKLHRPYPGIIAKVIYQPWLGLDPENLDTPPAPLDEQVANRWLAKEFTTPSALFPVPVLGIPNATPLNNNPHFYENSDVFRPKRLSTPNQNADASKGF